MSITQSVCVFVALRTQHAISMGHLVICGLSGCATIFHILYYTARFSKKKVPEHKMFVLIFATTFVWDISFYNNDSARHDHKCVLVFM